MTRSVIDPVTRIEGHLRVEMEVENGKVSDAWVSGGCFRGIELVVENRTPEDAAQIVQRICGVCPVSHAHASSIAAEKAYGITISNNARIIRNILEGAQFLHSHILWFYNLAGLDYVNPLNALKADPADLEALGMQAKASQISALLGGKMPHVMTLRPGGTAFVPTDQKLDDLKLLVDELYNWVEATMIPDVLAIAPYYADTSLGASSSARTSRCPTATCPPACSTRTSTFPSLTRRPSPSGSAVPGTRAPRPIRRRTSPPSPSTPTTT